MKQNTNYDKVKLLRFGDLGDERGSLIVVEGERDVPSAIQRVFYIYGSDATVMRGQHANRNTEFVLVNVAVKSKVRVDDGLGREQVYHLDQPNTGIYIPRMVWKDMYDFSPDSVLLVLCSEHYDGEEYIRDYEAFRAEMARESESDCCEPKQQNKETYENGEVYVC